LNGIAAVSAALDFTGNLTLPRGELFLGRDFLDRFFSDLPGGYFAQVAAAARSLGLSLVGVDLNGCPCSAHAESGGLEDYFVAGCLNGPVSRVIELQGFFKAMASVHRDRGLFTEAADLFVEEVETTARFACARGFQALAIADDIAGKGGLFFSPHYFADQVWPVYRQAARIAKGMGLRTFFHSDGDTRKVIELLIKAGYDCIHPVDAQAGLHVDDLSKEFGPAVSFMGHIDIMGWGAEKIRAEIDCAEEGFRGGGLVLGSSCGISMATVGGQLGALYPDGTTLLEAARKAGVYGILCGSP
jgi:uroporphyrinogen decarboxylase